MALNAEKRLLIVYLAKLVQATNDLQLVTSYLIRGAHLQKSSCVKGLIEIGESLTDGPGHGGIVWDFRKFFSEIDFQGSCEFGSFERSRCASFLAVAEL